MNSFLWDKFWRERDVEEIYPTITDIESEILKSLKDLKGLNILEVGAGTGRTALSIAQKGAHVYIIDISDESLKKVSQLKEKYNIPINIIQADGLNTPFEDNFFDLVYHQGLLEHFRNPYPLLIENKRILKKNGYLLVDVPQKFHIYTLIKHAAMIFNKWFAGWEREFTPNQLIRMVKQLNMCPVRLYGDWARPGIVYRMLRLLLLKAGIKINMYPKYGNIQKIFYNIQKSLKDKRIFLYSHLSIGIIAQKC